MAALPQSPWFSVVGGPPPAEEVLRAVMLSLVLPLGGLCVGLLLPESWRVRLDNTLLAKLSDWLKPENVRVIYQ